MNWPSYAAQARLAALDKLRAACAAENIQVRVEEDDKIARLLVTNVSVASEFSARNIGARHNFGRVRRLLARLLRH